MVTTISVFCRDFFARKCLKNRSFLEKADAQNLQNFVQTPVELKFLLDDGDQDVDADGDPDLRLHSVRGGAVKRLDAQVLLDPFEEQFHLPTAFVQLGNRQGIENKVVGQEDETLAGVRIDVLDASEVGGVFDGGIDSSEDNGLIAAQSGALVHATLRHAAKLKILLAAGDEERHVLLKPIQAAKVDVATVHDIEGTGFQKQMVEGFDIVGFSAGNVDKTGDVAAQVDEGMEFDRRLAPAKLRPGEQGQTEIDGRGIEGIDRFFQIDCQWFAGIKVPGMANEDMGKIGVDAPVATRVGLGQGVPRHRTTNADVIQLGAERIQTDFDVAQTGPVCQLGKRHAQKLIETGEPPRAIIALVSAHATIEIAFR